MDRYDGSMNVTVDHRDNIIFNPILITLTFTSNDDFKPFIGGITSSKCIFRMGLFKCATHTMNADFPKL